MRVLFAEDIGGWILAGGVLFGGLATSVLALIATVWLVIDYAKVQSDPDPSYNATPDFFMELLIMAGPALVTSLLAMAVLWYKRHTIFMLQCSQWMNPAVERDFS
jgi:hypothetical protein